MMSGARWLPLSAWVGFKLKTILDPERMYLYIVLGMRVLSGMAGCLWLGVGVLGLKPARQGSLVSTCIGRYVLSTGFSAPGGWYTG